jgi:NAD(P)H-quinone oxidoreductase subunit 5
MSGALLLETGVLLGVASPALLLALLGLASLRRRPLREANVARMTSAAMTACLAGLATASFVYVSSEHDPGLWTARTWFSSYEGAFRFDFLVDGGSLAFALLAAAICAVVARFSYRYLHREPGFQRYFTLFAVFVLGTLLVALAGSIEVLFAGWELIGLSSALLVAFFHERPAPAINGLRVFAAYRLSDAAMLVTAVLLHHYSGSGSLAGLLAGAAPPPLTETQATLICVFLIAAVAGKSALLPLSGWLPRAMEGPTPSSAVYYGALSVHAGCYLLWRASPLLEQSLVAQVMAGLAGASTALYATLVARVQTDVKSALAYASLTQVGLIVLEIALGFQTFAFVHLCGHACFRLLQFLTAPSVLHDLHELQGEGVDDARDSGDSPRWRGLYLFALERGFLDALLDRCVTEPFCRVAGLLDRLDRALVGESATPAGEPGDDGGA